MLAKHPGKKGNEFVKNYLENNEHARRALHEWGIHKPTLYRLTVQHGHDLVHEMLLNTLNRDNIPLERKAAHLIGSIRRAAEQRKAAQ